MSIVNWVPDNEIAALWESWVQMRKEEEAPGFESRGGAPGRDEPASAEKPERERE
jgi:hypothetical protein